MAAPSVQIKAEGLAEAQAAIKGMGRAIAKADRDANREVAREVVGWLRRGGSTPAQRRVADSFRPRATAKVAKVAVFAKGGNAMANAEIMGTRRRSGWNEHSYTRPSPGQIVRRRRMGSGAKRQHPEWVGQSWTLGQPGQGPYIVRDVIPPRVGEIGDLYADHRAKAWATVFPEGGSE